MSCYNPAPIFVNSLYTVKNQSVKSGFLQKNGNSKINSIIFLKFYLTYITYLDLKRIKCGTFTPDKKLQNVYHPHTKDISGAITGGDPEVDSGSTL